MVNLSHGVWLVEVDRQLGHSWRVVLGAPSGSCCGLWWACCGLYGGPRAGPWLAQPGTTPTQSIRCCSHHSLLSVGTLHDLTSAVVLATVTTCGVPVWPSYSLLPDKKNVHNNYVSLESVCAIYVSKNSLTYDGDWCVIYYSYLTGHAAGGV